MGLMLAEPGFHTRCYVEWEEYPRSVLISAQRAGYFVPAPIWDDLTTFDAKPFRGAFDTILAGYPCQPFSQAGQRKGADDERHLWPDVARIIREVDPEWVFLENVAGHVSLGLETVLRNLWDMGLTPAVGLFSAAETGAPHERLRVFIVAHRNSGLIARRLDGGKSGSPPEGGESGYAGQGPTQFGQRLWPEPGCGGDPVADAGLGRPCQPREGQDQQPGRAEVEWSGDAMDDAARDGRDGSPAHGSTAERGRPCLFPPGPGDGAAWSAVIGMAPGLAPSVSFGDIARRAQELVALADQGELAQAAAESELRRMVDGMASRSRALRLLGNGVFPLGAANAWRALASSHGLRPVDLDADGCSPETDTGELLVSAVVRGELK